MKASELKIAVLSGKGGTGKTLVSVNLAATANNSTYIDCDVEEPNGHLFLKPKDIKEEIVKVFIPSINEELCNGCRKCVEFCNFNALAFIKNKVMLFDEICHSCGGCMLICPNKAITEKEKTVGIIQSGVSDNVKVISGFLNTGEASGVPIIKKLLNTNIDKSNFTIIDCPPGSACTAMESIRDADYCILVAEPTLFGVHNLNLVYELVQLFHKPYGVILNKCTDEENPAEEFCIKNNIKILGMIPFDNELGTINSSALIAVRESQRYKDLFVKIFDNVKKEVQHETAVNP